MADSILKIRTQDGDKPIGYPGLADKPVADKTLAIEGAFADAKVVGDNFKKTKTETDSLKEDIGDICIKSINYLNYTTKKSGVFYFHNSKNTGNNDNTSLFKEIKISKGKTYYYKNLYAYFCNIFYDNGNSNALSETSNAAESGSFTANDNGIILISVSNKVDKYVFTEDENYTNDSYVPNLLKAFYSNNKLITSKKGLENCDDADNNKLYQIVIAKGTTEKIIENSPFLDVWKTNSVCLLLTFGKSKDRNIGDTQVFISDKEIYRRSFIYNGSETVWNVWTVLANSNGKKTIIVAKDGSGNYTSLTNALINESENLDCHIYVRAGEYDIIQEFKQRYGSDFFDNYSDDSMLGIILKNRIHVTFDTKAKVICKYSGENKKVMSKFSPFNSGVYGFTLENLTIECANVRYCVHDERSTRSDGYCNKYIRCDMKMDNSQNIGWSSKQCIGGGLGQNGDILVEDSVFESVGISSGYGIVSWHNCVLSDAKSSLLIKNNIFKGESTFRLSWYGTSTEITTAIVCNNSFGAKISHRAESSEFKTQNTNIEEWNNIIR